MIAPMPSWSGPAAAAAYFVRNGSTRVDAALAVLARDRHVAPALTGGESAA